MKPLCLAIFTVFIKKIGWVTTHILETKKLHNNTSKESKVHDTKSESKARSWDEENIMTRKQKAETKSGDQEEQKHSSKKVKQEDKKKGSVVKNEDKDDENGKEEVNSAEDEDIKQQFLKFCKETSEHLSVQQMRQILEANGQDAGEHDDAVVPRCQDILFYGPLGNCPICGGKLDASAVKYSCKGSYSEWSTCTFTTKDPPRKNEALKLPESIKDTPVAEMLRKHQDPKSRPKRKVVSSDKSKPFKGMMISLSGRLSRTHQYWKSKIEKNGGKVSNNVIGVNCLVVSTSERDRGGSSKLAEATEKGIPVVREAWLSDSIEKKDVQPLGAYDVVSDLPVGGRGIPLYQMDPAEEALETLTAELKMYGKRGVHKDSKLQDEGGQILEKDGILYNCAFTASDKGRAVNQLCVIQLIQTPDNRLYMYYKKGNIGDDAGAEERVDEWHDVNNAIKEFAKQFQELTGNEFELWEIEKKIQKKPRMFFPIDTDDGIEVRHGGLALRQLGAAALHCKLEPKVANFMKVLCSQEIYRYALMEMGLDTLDIPIGMFTDLHLNRCEELLHEYVHKLKSQNFETSQKAEAVWSDFSQRWFTLMPSTRPYIFHDFNDFADHAAAAFETVRDITVASHLVRDMSGATIEDPLFDRYKKLGCSITPLDKETDDYKMISTYLERTYEPVQVGEISYGVSLVDIFAVEVSACPSLEEVKKLPNKVLLWCGTRTSNLLRHLQKGFLPAVCYLPVPGYVFGKAIVCSDSAAEAAKYGFTAVDRPEGFLVLAVASLGEEITELKNAPEDTSSFEEKKLGVKGLGKKKTDESEHFVWKDDIKVPCGKLVPSGNKDSPLEYNEYAVYDPKQVSIRFLVSIKFEEKDVVYDTEEL